MVIFRTTVPPLVCIFVALVLAAVFVLVAVPLVLHVVEASTLKLELTKLLVGSSASDPVLHVVTLPNATFGSQNSISDPSNNIPPPAIQGTQN
jgi:hypothetical protein